MCSRCSTWAYGSERDPTSGLDQTGDHWGLSGNGSRRIPPLRRAFAGEALPRRDVDAGQTSATQLGIATDYTRYWARFGRQRALYESRVIRSEVLSDKGVSTGSFLSSYSH